jgi:hypothetical protein
MKYVKMFVILALVAILLFIISLYKPPLKNASTDDLDGIYGIVCGGVIMESVQSYILEHPNCKVEDLRSIKGVDDMIIDQLKERFR